ncbi:hypothetical protein Pelo_17771 [Pelomyxa schiedti]|nr:hypothetical protein Pelo_17771 [Pelomyxa schiedti]
MSYNNTHNGDSAAAQHAIAVSRVVWDWVVAPGWLLGTTNPSVALSTTPEDIDRASVALYRVAGGLFPLVPRACAFVGRMFPRVSRYTRLRCAACAPAPSCITWIKSHLSADCGMMPMMVASRKKKECVAVLTGLLCCGHVDLAVGLVNGTPTWSHYKCGVTWPGAPGSPGDADMKEDIKGCNWYNSRLCQSSDTPLESVKWIVGWLGMREPWHLVQLAVTAIVCGNVPVAQWLVMEFGLERVLTGTNGVASLCARSKSPILLKWWLENFSLPDGEDKKEVLRYLVCNEFSSIELCQWVKKQLEIKSDVTLSDLDWPNNPQCLRWAIEEFSLSLTEDFLNRACQFCCDLEVVKWMVIHKSVTPTPETCLGACCCRKENLEVVKWLSQRVALSPRDHQVSLLWALSCSNTDTADWLDSTFHVMNVVNSTPGSAGSLFTKMLRNIRGDSHLHGVQWFLQHVDVTQLQESSAAREAILETRNVEAVFLVLKACHISLQDNTEVRRHVLQTALRSGSMSDVRRLQSLVTLSADDIKCTRVNGTSSKTVKWVVSQVGVEYFKEQGIHTVILDSCIDRRKSHCLIWLMETWGLQLHEIFRTVERMPLPWNIDLNTWKLIINKFSPTQEEAMAEARFVEVVTSQPAITEWSITRFSLSQTQVMEYISKLDYIPSLVRVWLACHNL